MVHFKCVECGSTEHSSCIDITPCQKCGGKIEVESVGEKEEKNELD